MSVVSAEEIATFGANNLHDILRRVAGINPVNGAVLRDNLVSIRGQHSGTIDRRVLLLIDGRPYRDGHAGGVNENFYRTFPISAIEKIEIIRGPGSVLYGSSATSGVINIVTRKDAHTEVSVFGGSFETAASEFSGAGRKGELTWQANGKYLYSSGWPYASVDLADSRQTEKLSLQDKSVQFGVGFYGFSASLFSSKIDEEVFDSSLQFFWPSDRYVKRQDVYNLGYKTEWRDNWSVDINITHNAHDRRTDDGATDIEAETTLLEATFDGELHKHLFLVSGLSYQTLGGNDFSNPTSKASWDQTWRSAYYQFRYEPLNKLDVTFGQHYTDIKNTTSLGGDKNANDTSSRIAVGWTFIDAWKLKLLWSEAYRSPFGGELSFQSFLLGNPDLEPEQVDTKEMQFLYAQRRWSASANVFRSVYQDEIVIVPRGNEPGLTYRNQGELKIKGGELEFAYDPTNKIRITGSYSVHKNLTDGNSRDSVRISEEMYKLGLAYKAHEGIKLGLFNTFFSESPVASENSGSVMNPEAEGYHHMSVNLMVEPAKWKGWQLFKTLKISLYGDNLLEEEAPYQPDLTATAINTFPARAGRAWYLKLYYGF
ncbi:MAG: TonB-dependent receptor [Agarilytica sp.]